MKRRRLLAVAAGVVFAVGGLGLSAIPASAIVDYEPQIDHLKCYTSNPNATAPAPNAPSSVTLADQFGTQTLSVVRKPTELCNPAAKEHNGVVTGFDEGIFESPHLVCHDVKAPTFRQRDVWVHNQFGQARLVVVKPTRLCLPSFKFFEFCGPFTPLCDPPPDGVVQPEGLDHFLCYETKYRNSEKDIFKPTFIRVFDQFDFAFFGIFGFANNSQVKLTAPKQICNPVEKRRGGEITPITNPVDHLVCFGTEFNLPNERNTVIVQNQFGRSKFTTKFDKRFCVPSLKSEGGTKPPEWMGPLT